MRQSESLVVLKLYNFNFVAVNPTKDYLRGYNPREIHCFGCFTPEEELDLRQMASACNAPLHFYNHISHFN